MSVVKTVMVGYEGTDSSGRLLACVECVALVLPACCVRLRSHKRSPPVRVALVMTMMVCSRFQSAGSRNRHNAAAACLRPIMHHDPGLLTIRASVHANP